MRIVEVRVRKLGKDGWKEHLPETSDEDNALEKFIDSLIEKYGAETKGSYKLILKLNGGYGKNPDNGMTLEQNWKGPFNRVYIFLPVATKKRNLYDY